MLVERNIRPQTEAERAYVGKNKEEFDLRRGLVLAAEQLGLLSKLTERGQKILVLRYCEGKSLRQVAAELGIRHHQSVHESEKYALRRIRLRLNPPEEKGPSEEDLFGEILYLRGMRWSPSRIIRTLRIDRGLFNEIMDRHGMEPNRPAGRPPKKLEISTPVA